MFYLKTGDHYRPYRVDLTVCQGFFDRLTGALIDGEIPYREGLLFPNCRSIHTFFMRSSIAVLTFDDSGSILDYRPRVSPFRLARGSAGVSGLLELAPDRLDESKPEVLEGSIRFVPDVAERVGYPELAYEQ